MGTRDDRPFDLRVLENPSGARSRRSGGLARAEREARTRRVLVVGAMASFVSFFGLAAAGDIVHVIAPMSATTDPATTTVAGSVAAPVTPAVVGAAAAPVTPTVVAVPPVTVTPPAAVSSTVAAPPAAAPTQAPQPTVAPPTPTPAPAVVLRAPSTKRSSQSRSATS